MNFFPELLQALRLRYAQATPGGGGGVGGDASPHQPF